MMKIFTKIQTLKTLTLSADASPEVVTQLEGILDSDTGGDPHLLKLGQVLALSDTDNQFLVVPLPGEEIQEVDPELSHTGRVLAPARPRLVDSLIPAEPGVPPVNHVLRSLSLIQFLEHGQHGRLNFLNMKTVFIAMVSANRVFHWKSEIMFMP